ncbi:hypothetical protein, partial [Nonomuraea sp. NPDC005650]|uniref:hypothetical protein n=1 Tax=Nonomuraea sp. NPDC005650 TaxID=3157045 RepID=UPI0033B9B201
MLNSIATPSSALAFCRSPESSAAVPCILEARITALESPTRTASVPHCSAAFNAPALSPWALRTYESTHRALHRSLLA